MNYALILAGGSGSRLWPYSRSKVPKQFFKLSDPDYTLLQQTYRRLLPTLPKEHIWVISHHQQVDEVKKQIAALQEEGGQVNVLSEPERKNTAPAILWAALVLNEVDENSVIAILPSDHVIRKPDIFNENLNKAFELANEGYMVTFGIHPNSPETGFGYIRMGEEIATSSARHILEFVEKPNLSTAEYYLAQGNYLWNSGMFVFSTKTVLNHFKTLSPDLWAVFQEAKNGCDNWNTPEVTAKAFNKARAISFDYAIMEKAKKVAVIPFDPGWSDLGSWESIFETNEKDADGNVTMGDVVSLDTKNSLIFGNKRLVTTIGVEDLIVVETQDSILICDMKQSQNVKKLVELLKSKNRSEIIE